MGSISAQYAPHEVAFGLAAALRVVQFLHRAGVWRAAAGAGLCAARGPGSGWRSVVGCTMWAHRGGGLALAADAPAGLRKRGLALAAGLRFMCRPCATLTDLGRPVAGVLWMLASGLAFVGGQRRSCGIWAPTCRRRSRPSSALALGCCSWRRRCGRRAARGFRRRCCGCSAGAGRLHVAAVIFWFYAMARVPVAEMAAIGFLNPVMVLVMARRCCWARGWGARRVLAVAGGAGGGADRAAAGPARGDGGASVRRWRRRCALPSAISLPSG